MLTCLKILKCLFTNLNIFLNLLFLKFFRNISKYILKRKFKNFTVLIDKIYYRNNYTYAYIFELVQ